MLGGGGRGLGVLNVFVPLYLARVIGLDTGTVALMYTVLLIGSVPGPLIAGWLSDIYRAQADDPRASIGWVRASLAAFVLAGSNLRCCGSAIVLLSTFNFVESPQLQALLADIAPPALRDAPSRCTSRWPSASGRSGSRFTARSSRSPASRPACRSRSG